MKLAAITLSLTSGFGIWLICALLDLQNRNAFFFNWSQLIEDNFESLAQ